QITRILFFVLLISSYSHCFDYHIEFDRCAQFQVCFIRESCYKGKTSTSNLFVAMDKDNIDSSCDVVLQIRRFTSKKWHVMLQVNGSLFPDSISDDGVIVKQNVTQFQCNKLKGPHGNPTLFGTNKYGDRQIYEDRFIFCSFTVEALDGKQSIITSFLGSTQNPSIEFPGNQERSIKYDSFGAGFWAKIVEVKCNPDLVVSSNSSDDNHVLQEVETTHMEIKCNEAQTLL
ncbi:hypothetical protein PFISCL1PPCAC_18733, partial [Pristionchus fissidentatus]